MREAIRKAAYRRWCRSTKRLCISLRHHEGGCQLTQVKRKDSSSSSSNGPRSIKNRCSCGARNKIHIGSNGAFDEAQLS